MSDYTRELMCSGLQPPKGEKTALFPVGMWKLNEQITSFQD